MLGRGGGGQSLLSGEGGIRTSPNGGLLGSSKVENGPVLVVSFSQTLTAG